MALAAGAPLYALSFGGVTRPPTLTSLLADTAIAALGTGVLAFAVAAVPVVREAIGSWRPRGRRFVTALTALGVVAASVPVLPAAPALALTARPRAGLHRRHRPGRQDLRRAASPGSPTCSSGTGSSTTGR